MSRIETYNLTLTVRVYDTAALAAAAIKHAMTVDGMSEAEARETLADISEDDGIDVGACLQMLLDPGVSPDGCSIQESSVDYLFGEDEDANE